MEETSQTNQPPLSISFYSRSDPYFEFSNYYYCPFVDDQGREFYHTEGYFHFKKFEYTDPVWAELIRKQKKPSEAKKMGNSRQHPIHKDWDDLRLAVMTDAIRYKFGQHSNLLKLLKSTGNSVLIEASPTDYFWGQGSRKTGQNHLGRLLMEFRAQNSTI